MSESGTIVAIASAPGAGARGVVRLSGPGAHDMLRAVGGGSAIGAGGAEPPVARAVRLSVEGLPDIPALAVVSHAPRTYTGEPTVELFVAGSPDLLEAVETAMIDAGARRAEPGEFTARAFLNGRLSLDRAEGVGLLIGARSREEWEAGRRLLRGEEGARAAALSDEAARLLALVEAGIDFTDQEDVVPIPRDALCEALRGMESRLSPLVSRSTGERAGGAVRIMLAGAPNAGKSTLFNALLGRGRAVVSDRAHTTRDVLVEPFDLGGDARLLGVEATLADIAGLDPSADLSDLAQSLARCAAEEALRSADVVVHCDPEGRFRPLGVVATVLRVRTKADIGARGREDDSLPVCALDGWNLDSLRRAIADAASAAGSTARADAALLPRHRDAYEQALTALRAARAEASEGAGPGLDRPELIAASLREALDELGRIAGAVHRDDIIGRVFATFCVGK